MTDNRPRHRWATLATCAGLALIASACGSDGATGSAPAIVTAPVPSPPPSPPPPSPPPVTAAAMVEREIIPSQTSAAITTNLSPHVVINPDPAVAARGRLFVMLPGTGAVARTYRQILRTGAPRGYHAIGLTYPNDDAVASLCSNRQTPDCAGQFRREVILGENASPLIDVNQANSITARLIALLRYLATTFPNEGWGQYLINGEPNWSVISVAGHSQGSGHAAYLAKLHRLDRSIMFSGPTEPAEPSGAPALWLGLPNVTPASRQYGFTHTADPLALAAQVTGNWRAIGIDAFGAPVSVDGNAPPFGNSRQLLTSAAPNPNPTGITASPNHGAPVADAVTPLTGQGTPLFASVWAYLAFPLGG